MLIRFLFSCFVFLLTLTLSAQQFLPLIEYYDGELVGLSDEEGKIYIKPRFASIKVFPSGKRMKQYRRVSGFDGATGAVDLLTDSLLVPLRRGNTIGLTEYGFIVWNERATKERTLLLNHVGNLLHADSTSLSLSPMDKDRGIYLSSKGYWDDPKDIVRITSKEYKVLYTDIAIKRTYTGDINSPQYLESLIHTDPEEKTELYLNENFELKTRSIATLGPNDNTPSPLQIEQQEDVSPPPPPSKNPISSIRKGEHLRWTITAKRKNKHGLVSAGGEVYLPAKYDSIFFPALEFRDSEYYFLVKKNGKYNLVSKTNTWSNKWLEEIRFHPYRLKFAKNNKLYLHDHDMVVIKDKRGYSVASLFGKFMPQAFGDRFYYLSSSTTVLVNKEKYTTVNASSMEVLETKDKPVSEKRIKGRNGFWSVKLEDKEGNTIGYIGMDGKKHYRN